MTRQFAGPCPVCGGTEFKSISVLWPELISAWQLGGCEVDYINRQQGFFCQQCDNNLRTMGLASALLRLYAYQGTLAGFCEAFAHLRVLEINTAGHLTPFLRRMPGHRLVEYPMFDMMNLELESGAFDIVIHSDSLEHVRHPVRALSECRRVLADNGHCVFTVPIVVGRMTRSCAGLPPSYHGVAHDNAPDQLVCTEFGADAWQTVLQAGFASCEIVAFEYPAALTIVAAK